MDCSHQPTVIYGISQARILEWVAISFSMGSAWPRMEPVSAALAGRFFTTEPPGKPSIVVTQSQNWFLFPFIKVISGSNNILYRIVIFHIKVTITKRTIPSRRCFRRTKVSQVLYFKHRDIPVLTFYFILFLPGCGPYPRQILGFVFFKWESCSGHYQVVSSH